MSFLESMDANGIKLSFVEKGTGPPVILVHGIPTDYRAWENQMNVLSEFQDIKLQQKMFLPQPKQRLQEQHNRKQRRGPKQIHYPERS
jgi:PhoPQ-activated pathogenicity-related protein